VERWNFCKGNDAGFEDTVRTFTPAAALADFLQADFPFLNYPDNSGNGNLASLSPLAAHRTAIPFDIWTSGSGDAPTEKDFLQRQLDSENGGGQFPTAQSAGEYEAPRVDLQLLRSTATWNQGCACL
jgi:hypothetical protein